ANVALYLSKALNPFEAYAGASTAPAPSPPPNPPAKSVDNACTLSAAQRSIYGRLTEEHRNHFNPAKHGCGELSSHVRENLGALICVLKKLESARGLSLNEDEKLMAAWWAGIEGFLERSPQGFAVCYNVQSNKPQRAPGSNCDAGFYSGGWQVGYGNQVF